MSNRKYISFSVSEEEYERIKKALEMEGEGPALAPFCREHVLGIVEIIVNDPLFSIAPCEACGHIEGSGKGKS